MLSLVLFSTTDCYLCDKAMEVIDQVWAEPVVAELGIAIEKQDVAESQELVDSYGQRIPVLGLLESGELIAELEWPFDRLALV